MAAPIAEEPLPGRVYWTAYCPPEGDSRPTDPLRFDMYAQRLGNLMLPGITNRTVRLRYLSMVCAGLAETASRSGSSLRERRLSFLPFERGWALAQTVSVDGALKERTPGGASMMLKPEFRGLRGANRVLSHFRGLGSKAAVSPSGYVLLKSQDAQGGLGAYLVTLRRFGFVHDGSLELTALGSELAAAFKPGSRRRLATLVEPGEVKRSALGRLGEDLCLGWPSPDERRIVRAAVFEDERQPAADCVARIRAARPDSEDPEELLEGIARADGDPLERAAHFAICFDPMRVALLEVFAQLGRAILGRIGEPSLGELATPELEAAATTARAAAAKLAACRTPDQLERISELAADVAAGSSLTDTVSSTVSFHRREGRSWILADGRDRFSLGRAGSFDDSGALWFNGYTVGSAMSLFADAEASG